MSSSGMDDEELHFPVHLAAETGDVMGLRRLLAEAQDESPAFGGGGYFGLGVGTAKADLVNERSSRGWTPLHVALAHRHLSVVECLLEEGAECRKLDGSPCLHFALCLAASSLPGTDDFVEKVVQLLLPRADWSAKDDRKQTALHVAATFGLSGAVTALAALGPELLELKDRTGNRALHYAAMNLNGKANGIDAITALLTVGANVNSVQVLGKTPLHVAAETGFWDGFRVLVAAGADATKVDKRGRTPVQLAIRSGQAVPTDLHVVPPVADATGNGPCGAAVTAGRTAVLSHPLCREHFTCPPIHHGSPDPPPENVNRLRVLLDMPNGVLRSREFRDMEFSDDAQRADLADVLRVHEWAYVRRLQLKCQGLHDFIPDVPGMDLPPPGAGMGFPGPGFAHLDGDTVVSARTFEAALRAAGSVVEGVDRVMTGRNRNVFCAVRPPGHHAGMRGVVTNENDENGSHGFCLLNNVGIAAAYARHVYRGRVDKVAIVDFDVHHGNGTEEVVRNLVPAQDEFVTETPVGRLATRSDRWKPWLNEDDHEKVLFVSSHGYGKKSEELEHVPGGWFYPGSGSTCVPGAPVPEAPAELRAAESDYLSGYESETRGDRHRILDLGLGLATREVAGTARNRFRDGYRKVILPRLMAFNPDLILISAGFDGHKKDDINFGYLSLVEEDFEWVTEELIKVANSCCDGRVVSVLEGGYAIKGSHVSAFARSSAAHLRAMLRNSRYARPWDAGYSAWESKMEHDLLEKAKERQERKNRESLAQLYGGKDLALLAQVGQLENATGSRDGEGAMALPEGAKAAGDEEAAGAGGDGGHANFVEATPVVGAEAGGAAGAQVAVEVGFEGAVPVEAQAGVEAGTAAGGEARTAVGTEAGREAGETAMTMTTVEDDAPGAATQAAALSAEGAAAIGLQDAEASVASRAARAAGTAGTLGEDQPRKRRRGNVDYVALAQKLGEEDQA